METGVRVPILRPCSAEPRLSRTGEVFLGKNIWYVHPYAGGPGVGRYIRAFALAKYWQAQGARVTIFTAANHHQLDRPLPPGPRTISGVDYEFIPCRGYANNGLGRLLNMGELTWNLLRKGNAYAKGHGMPDAIISSSPHPYAFLAAHRLARRFNARSVFEVRDLWPLGFVELLGVSKWHPLVLFTGWLERYAYRHADAVVSLLPKTKPYMVDRGLESTKWHYIPNGIDVDVEGTDIVDESVVACVSKAKAYKERGYTVVAYTGALGQPNHVEALIEAIAIAKKVAGPQIAAIIVGRGERASAIEALINGHGLGGQVEVFGQIPKHGIPQLLELVDIGYISLKTGPLFRFGISPNKLFDYMFAGLPILSTIDAGNDPVADANCGITTASNQPEVIADALLSLACLSKNEREELGQNGKDFVLKNHSYSILAQQYMRLLFDS